MFLLSFFATIIIGGIMRIRIKIILFLMLMMLPFFIFANTYENERIAVNNYLDRSSFVETYYRYFLDGKDKTIPFAFDRISAVTSSEYKMAGMVSRDEYKLSKGNKGSWLYDGASYWTLTSSGDKHYTIAYGGDKLVSDSDTSYKSRATAYVKTDVKVSGTGSANDPWVFEQMYKVTVTTDPNKGKVYEETNNKYYVGRCLGTACTANVKVEPLKGLIYITNNCNARYNRDSNILSLNYLTRDTKCNVTFGTGLFDLKLTGLGTGAAPTDLAVKFDENFYRGDKKTIIKKLDSLPVRTGYDFSGYKYINPDTLDRVTVIDSSGKFIDNAKNKIISSGDLVASWNAKEYTVSFNPNGGSVSPTTKVVTYEEPYGELPLPKKDGYNFNGWIDENGNKILNSTIVTISKNHTLKATWSTITYSVAYDLEKGTFGAQHPNTVYYDNEFTVNTPTKSIKLIFDAGSTGATFDYTGAGVSGNNQSVPYTFNGWTITEMDNVTHYFGSTTSNATSATGRKETSFKNLRSTEGSVKFTAKWQKLSIKLPKIVKYGHHCRFVSDEYVWNSGATYETSETNSATERRFSVNCEQYIFNVTYDANTGVNPPQPDEFEIGNNVTLTTSFPTKKGNFFIGWNEDPNAQESQYNPGKTYKFNGNKKLYAIWTPRLYLYSYGNEFIPTTGGWTYKLVEVNGNGHKESDHLYIGHNVVGSTASQFSTAKQLPPGEYMLHMYYKKESCATTYWGYSYYQFGDYRRVMISDSTIGMHNEFFKVILGKWSTFTYGNFDSNDRLYEIYLTSEDVSDNRIYITYDLNGGYYSDSYLTDIENQTTLNGKSFIINVRTPIRSGYTFLGYSLNKNATSATYSLGQTVSFTSDVVLYAVWRKN